MLKSTGERSRQGSTGIGSIKPDAISQCCSGTEASTRSMMIGQPGGWCLDMPRS